MTPAERLARGIHDGYCRIRGGETDMSCKVWEQIPADKQQLYLALATDLLDEQSDLLWSVLREVAQHPATVTQQPTAFIEPSHVHDALFGRVLAALAAILAGLDAFADEDRPDPEPQQWATRLSEAREALTYGLLSRLSPPPTEGE